MKNLFNCLGKLIEKYKLFLGIAGAILLFIILLFIDTGGEGYLPITAFSTSISIIILLIIIDQWRNRDIYRKKYPPE